MGHNTLSDMIPQLSVRANLSKRYTNHCVRASVITDLKDAGYANHEVCAITGHKNEGSIESYDRLDRAGSHRPAEMADVLDGKAVSSAHRATSAVVQPVQSAESRNQPSHGGIVFKDQAFVQNLTINYNIIGSDEKK